MYGALYGFVFLSLVATIQAKFDESLLTEEMKELMATVHKTCVDQIEITEAEIDKLKGAVFEDNKKTKCYVKCVMSEIGVMDENGEIDVSAAAEMVPEKIREESIKRGKGCVKHGDGIEDKCEKAFKVIECIQKADPENYFFI